MTHQTLFVGIDVSKLKHDLAIVNEQKQLVVKPFVIADNLSGYQTLLAKLNALIEQYQTKQVYIGLEATGDYWKNIYYFLKKQSPGFIVHLINPVQTHAFAKTELRRAKTDKVNAKDIALFMVEKKPQSSFDRPLFYDIIKDIDGQIYHLKKQQTMLSNRLRIELTKVAPEIEKASDNIKGKQILALLAQYPTAEAIANCSVKELCCIRHGSKNWKLPLSFVTKIKKISENSIAYKTGNGSGYVVQSLVQCLLELQQQMDNLKQQSLQLFTSVNGQPSILETIPGISAETAAILEAYIGDVNRFSNAKKFVAYFGMNPVINLSGKSKRASYLQKKGNPIVRHKLFMATLVMISRKVKPVYPYYKKLVDGGKPKLVAIGAAMRKLLVIIYYMLKNQQEFKK